MEKSFHKRNLPHLYFFDGQYFITYRLKNTIPNKVLSQIHLPLNNWDFEKFNRVLKKYDNLLDSGEYGLNYLSNYDLSDICRDTLYYPDGKEYRIICYCIMSNHIHLVFELLDGNKGVSKIMQSIKGISARKCNIILGRKGSFWQDESFDRLIRDDKELFYIIRYVLLNPVKAGLVNNWYDWKYSFCNPDFMVL